MYHLTDGLYFERVENQDGMGDVHIVKRYDAMDESPIQFEVTIPHYAWESIIAAMSASGESAAYEWAKAFHRGIGGGV